MRKSYLRLIAMWVGLATMSTAGCLPLDEFGSDYDYYDDDYSGDTTDETEDRLLVSGSGENLLLEYNGLAFPALLNWEDGNYYFSPDPDGSLSGDKIICLASIDDYKLEGDCFRAGRVCHFYYYESWSEFDDKDMYSPSSTSCKTAGDVGPFLVPLEAPVCGEDPFPACPTGESLFPSGPADKLADPVEETKEAIDSSVVDSVIQKLCAAAARCDKALTEEGCLEAMEGEAGKRISDDLRMVEPEDQMTTAEVRKGIDEDSIAVHEDVVADCLQGMVEACDNEGESFEIGSYENIESLIAEEGSCIGIFEQVHGL